MEPTSRNFFALALQEAMYEIGSGQQQLIADRAGLNTAYISKLRHGKINATVDNLESVAVALGRNYPDMLARGFRLWRERFGEAQAGPGPDEDEVRRLRGELAELTRRVERLEAG